ncbi:MAG TPA: PEP-CTERM sorting domain-containing protein [Stellaceae bacterium]
MSYYRVIALTLLLLSIWGVPAFANLVVDPGFESCTDGGTQPPGWSGNGTCALSPHSGDWAGFLDRNPGTLSQSIATTPGIRYDFSFWLATDGSPGGGISDFSASFGAEQVLDLTNSPGFRYRLEDFTVTAAATSTVISFIGFSQLFWLVDDVSVVPAPEPASLALLAASLLGLGAVCRTRLFTAA